MWWPRVSRARGAFSMRRRSSRESAPCIALFGIALFGLMAARTQAFTARASRAPGAATAKGDTVVTPTPYDPAQPVVIDPPRSVKSPGLGASGSAQFSQLTADGSWSWFGDPRAVCAGPRLFIGWITSTGEIKIGSLDRAGTLITATLQSRFEIDDHDNPSILRLADGRLMVFYSPHAGAPMFYRVSTNPDNISSWGPLRNVPQDTR